MSFTILEKNRDIKTTKRKNILILALLTENFIK